MRECAGGVGGGSGPLATRTSRVEGVGLADVVVPERDDNDDTDDNVVSTDRGWGARTLGFTDNGDCLGRGRTLCFLKEG